MSGQEIRFQGIGVAPGIARGVVFIHHPDDEEPPKTRIHDSEVAKEIVRFESALIATRAQILEMQQRIAEAIGAKDASIFDAHLLVVEDRTLIDEVTRRVIRTLLGRSAKTLGTIDLPQIVVAHNITPSDTATLNRQLVLGFATDVGSRTSHTAIMARSLNIPAVVGLKDISQRLSQGQHVLLDGTNGVVILNPTDETLWEYGEIEIKLEHVEEVLTSLRDTASTMTDGRHVILSANIELPEDVPLVIEAGAEGIGLYRTEFFFLNKNDLPSEEEQYAAYHAVAGAILPAGGIIFTRPRGGAKFVRHHNFP